VEAEFEVHELRGPILASAELLQEHEGRSRREEELEAEAARVAQRLRLQQRLVEESEAKIAALLQQLASQSGGREKFEALKAKALQLMDVKDRKISSLQTELTAREPETPSVATQAAVPPTPATAGPTVPPTPAEAGVDRLKRQNKRLQAMLSDCRVALTELQSQNGQDHLKQARDRSNNPQHRTGPAARLHLTQRCRRRCS
jgi:hypothetical protein